MRRTFLIALVGAALAASPALAKPGKGKGKDKDKDVVVVTKADRAVVFEDGHRQAVRTYWVETYGRGNCPPGLAKKRNGCLPPGQAKKRYVVGRALPAAVVFNPVPDVLVTRLGPVPAGYQYVMVDGDVLKMAVGTRLVVDAINAFID
jgi:hypothetical protein